MYLETRTTQTIRIRMQFVLCFIACVYLKMDIYIYIYARGGRFTEGSLIRIL